MNKKVATLKHLDNAIAVLKQFTADVAKAASDAIKSLTAKDVGALTEIKIGTVTTGAAGSNASASATTTGTVSTLNLTIPKGDKGDTGATGAKGDKGDKGDSGVHYGTCSTAAATAAKAVALTGFDLATGSAVIVRFTVTNTAANPTLNVNSTGAKAIRYSNAAISAGQLAANRTYEFVYDGTYWQLVGDLDTDTSHVSTGTISVPATGWGSDSTAIFPKYYDLSISGILATDRVDLIVAITSLDTVLKCGLCGITEASAGKVRIRSRTVPTAAISLQYWVMKI